MGDNAYNSSVKFVTGENLGTATEGTYYSGTSIGTWTVIGNSWKTVTAQFTTGTLNENYCNLGIRVGLCTTSDFFLDDVTIIECIPTATYTFDEATTDYWSSVSFVNADQSYNNTTAIVTEENEGNKSLKISFDGYDKTAVSFDFALKSNTTYQISYRFRGNVSSAKTDGHSIGVFSASYPTVNDNAYKANVNFVTGETAGTSTKGAYYSGTSIGTYTVIGNSWKTITSQFTTGTLNAEHSNLGIRFGMVDTFDVYLDDITIFECGGTVEFVSNVNVVEFESATGYFGEVISFPESPFGYEIDGWYSDAELTKPISNITVPLEGNTITVYADMDKQNPLTFDFSNDEQVLTLSGSATTNNEALNLIAYAHSQARAKLNYVIEEDKTYRVSFDSSITYPEANANSNVLFRLHSASAESNAWTMFYSNYVKAEDGTVTYDLNESKTVLCSMNAANSAIKTHYDIEFTIDSLPEDHRYLGIFFQPSSANTSITVDNLTVTEINGGTVNFEADVDGVTYQSITGYNGQVIDFPKAPLGYKINAWYLDAEHTVIAEKAIIPAKNENITYYAECEMLPATEEIPNAPVILSVKNNTVILEETEGCEYSCDGDVWQSSPIFEGLFDGIEYNFCQRMVATTEYSAGNSSQAVTYTIVRPCDADGSGKINSIDLASLRTYLLGNTVSVYKDGCDSNSDQVIDARDIVRLKKVIVTAAGKFEVGTNRAPAAGDYSFCSDTAVDGYITVTGIADYLCGNMGMMKTESGVEGWSTGEVYTETFIFVPKGTVINSTNQFKVYAYNGVFKSTGEISEYVNSYAIIKDSYIKWTIKSNSDLANSNQDELNTAASNLTIKIPESRINDFYVFDKFDSAAYAYAIEEVELLKDFAEIKTDGAVNYLFITDLHEGSNNDAIKRQLEEIVTIANNPDNDIDFVCLGGDISTGMRSTKDTYKSTLDNMLAPLNNCKVPVMVIKGNHDDNSYYYRFSYDKTGKTDAENAQVFADTVLTEAEWYEYMLGNYANDDNSAEVKTSSRIHDSKNTDSAYYYFDLAEKMTRVICLDAIDYGEPTADKNGSTWYGYGERQLEWLATEALVANDGWNYVFLSHMGYDSDITSINNIEALEGIMTAFQNKTSYGNYDFSNTTGKILSYQFGHTHFDVRYYDEELNIATMNIGTSGQYNVGVESDAMLGGTAGVELFRRPYTETEALFDLVSATTNKVYELRFGAGENTNYTLK